MFSVAEVQVLLSANSFCFIFVFKNFLVQETAPKVKAKSAYTAESAEEGMEGETAESDVEANLAETFQPMLLDLSREPYEN